MRALSRSQIALCNPICTERSAHQSSRKPGFGFRYFGTKGLKLFTVFLAPATYLTGPTYIQLIESTTGSCNWLPTTYDTNRHGRNDEHKNRKREHKLDHARLPVVTQSVLSRFPIELTRLNVFGCCGRKRQTRVRRG